MKTEIYALSPQQPLQKTIPGKPETSVKSNYGRRVSHFFLKNRKGKKVGFERKG